MGKSKIAESCGLHLKNGTKVKNMLAYDAVQPKSFCTLVPDNAVYSLTTQVYSGTDAYGYQGVKASPDSTSAQLVNFLNSSSRTVEARIKKFTMNSDESVTGRDQTIQWSFSSYSGDVLKESGFRVVTDHYIILGMLVGGSGSSASNRNPRLQIDVIDTAAMDTGGAASIAFETTIETVEDYAEYANCDDSHFKILHYDEMADSVVIATGGCNSFSNTSYSTGMCTLSGFKTGNIRADSKGPKQSYTHNDDFNIVGCSVPCGVMPNGTALLAVMSYYGTTENNSLYTVDTHSLPSSSGITAYFANRIKTPSGITLSGDVLFKALDDTHAIMVNAGTILLLQISSSQVTILKRLVLGTSYITKNDYILPELSDGVLTFSAGDNFVNVIPNTGNTDFSYKVLPFNAARTVTQYYHQNTMFYKHMYKTQGVKAVRFIPVVSSTAEKARPTVFIEDCVVSDVSRLACVPTTLDDGCVAVQSAKARGRTTVWIKEG